jgi:formylglycine-generating enzyme required for sulfatase activity
MKIARTLLLALVCLVRAAHAEPQPQPVLGEVWQEPSTGMRFIWIPGGCFLMGAEGHYAYERPRHQVCVKGFYLGVAPVTQAEYLKVAGKNLSQNTGPDLPVDSVTWMDAVKVSHQLAQASGKTIRLPTEAEWEYACRAGGRHDPYCGDGKLADLAWNVRNSDGHTQPVGRKKPNAWGLYDMNGNVWQWTLDCWHRSYYGAPADGSAWTAGGDCNIRVARGGSWGTVPDSTRAAARNADLAALDFTDTGFRLLREP